jgi:hypothetical protein
MHQTSNLDDGYLGSGLKLKLSIEKYGKDKHVRETLYALKSREDMIAKEIEIVTEELLKDPLCINLKEGGCGGSDSCSEVTKKRISESLVDYFKDNEPIRHTDEFKENLRQRNLLQGGHSEETKKRMSTSAQGKAGTIKGKKAIKKDGKKKFIHPEDTLPKGWEYVSKNLYQITAKLT